MIKKELFNLLHLSEFVLKVCESNQISIWPTDSSLLGIVQFGLCFVPWEENTYFAISSKNREKFCEHIAQKLKPGFLLSGDTCETDACKNERILSSFHHPSLQIHIKFIDEDNEDNSDIFPLIATHVIGHRIALPSRYTTLLHKQFGNDWNTKNNEILPPVRSLTPLHLQTIDDWINYSNWCKEDPFYIPHFPFFNSNRDLFAKMIEDEKQQIRGYGGPAKENQEVELIEGADEGHEYCGVAVYYMHDGITCWKQFNERRLLVNIHDQEMSTHLQERLLPPRWIEQSKKIIGDEWNCYSLTWVMTTAPKISGFHTDPDMCGGAWMYLIEGEKIWWFIHPHDWKYLQGKGYKVEDMAQLDMWELLQIENNYLYGKVFTGRLTAGGSMFFPSICLHKVITTQNSIGFGGYW